MVFYGGGLCTLGGDTATLDSLDALVYFFTEFPARTHVGAGMKFLDC